MCTLTYLPYQENFIITSNRDELVSRKKATFPNYLNSKRGEVIFPKDGDAGGSWIAASDQLVVCLLNGEYEIHERRNDYSLSRGLVLLEAFQYSTIEEFLDEFDFNGIEAFTMVFFELSNKRIVEFVWDEQDKFIKNKDFELPHIWSSVPLYSQEERMEKKHLFMEYIKKQNAQSPENLREFHKFKGENGQGRFLLTRSDIINTVSITSVFMEKGMIKMQYEDLEKEG